MLNNQPIEKREPAYDGTLQVHSIFKTIQGEGPFCGAPCVFIRLAGCNLQCPACDTDYTNRRARLSVERIAEIVAELSVKDNEGNKLVVITGGEPFRQHIGELISELINDGHYVQVESNGTMNPPQRFWRKVTEIRRGSYLVISPKTGKLNPLAIEAACALKYVVSHNNVRSEDGLPLTALGHPANPYPARPPRDWEGLVYVQPQDDKDPIKNSLNMQTAVASCMDHGYTLQIQVHKVVGVE